MIRKLCLLAIALIPATRASAEETREWTSKQGSKLQASLESLVDGTIKLKDPSGRTFTFPLDSLIEADQAAALAADRAANPILIANAASFGAMLGDFDKKLGILAELAGAKFEWRNLASRDAPFVSAANQGPEIEELRSWTGRSRNLAFLFSPPLATVFEESRREATVARAAAAHAIAAGLRFRPIAILPFPIGLHPGPEDAEAPAAINAFKDSLGAWQVVDTPAITARIEARFPVWKEGLRSIEDQDFVQLAMTHSAILGAPADLAGLRKKEGVEQAPLSVAAQSLASYTRWNSLSDAELTELAKIIHEGTLRASE